ncbi:ATP-binding protein [Brevundimonas sp.]|uniref:AAA family ATPase n=1 Tax=Brevundimonas sp. TaxID=1871086 RepID=UPI001201C4D3|nr:ATP-binding protein [Brevundimonas sp.]TAJ64227.1 MAG: DUF2813 domain-containing protein [Brevundimonas sp.]
MRLDRAYIDGFRNLKEFSIDFDEKRLTTVVIGQNGAGKSNLIEALVDVFRSVDLNKDRLHYRYEIDYRIGGQTVRLSNRERTPTVSVDGEVLSRKAFEARKSELFPDLVFGYYSGGGRRLERLFDEHQRRYYRTIMLSDDEAECKAALADRRLFYCRPIHGVFALVAFMAFPQKDVRTLLRDKLNITGFHSALAQFREPWFAKSARGSRDPFDLWGAAGPAGRCVRAILQEAFLPIALSDNPVDDYRDKNVSESQLAAFLRDEDALKRYASRYKSDAEMFAALEAADISDLFRELHLWLTREGDFSGDIAFSDFSDGERQLLMVLGLTRLSRGKRVLFLLDEPDTHLNPSWQNSYLELIRQWTEQGEDAENCQFVMTSHNPLTIAALKKEEVRVMARAEDGRVKAFQPRVDPRGLGFSGVLMDIFGLPSAIDGPTQDLISERNELARRAELSPEEASRLEHLSFKLGGLGISYEHRDSLYRRFLQALEKAEFDDDRPFTPDELEEIERTSRALADEALQKQ